MASAAAAPAATDQARPRVIGVRLSFSQAAATPSPPSKSAVADFDRFIEWPKPAYTRFRLGERWGGGSGGCGNAVPPLATPTPDPSPAETASTRGSVNELSDRSRVDPTSIGGGEEFAVLLRRKPAPTEPRVSNARRKQ